MNKLYRPILTIFFLVAVTFSLFAQNNFFTDAGENSKPQTTGQRVITPEKFRTSVLSIQGMTNFLMSLPSEKNVLNHNQAPIIELPMPNGTIAKFHVWESSIMEPGLAAKFPEIKTFAGQGIDDPYSTIRFDYNPYFGFHAQILSVKGDTYIDPYAKGDINFYSSYYTNDNKRNPSFICYSPDSLTPSPNISARTQATCRGTQLYTYRLALACTGEYAAAVCSPNAATVPATMAAMVTSVNRIDGVYETELSIRMILIANDDLLIYLNPATEPYSNFSPSALLGQNQINIDAVIGSANYDFGHVFTTGGGGLSAVGVVCVDGYKAESETGLPNPVGDNFDIDYAAHEMGHEFGAHHPFNGSTGNCGGVNRWGATAYEPGSGTTIMAYAGICPGPPSYTDDIQPHSDPYFHSISFDEISNYISGTGGACAVITNTGNSIPVITAMYNNGANIPLNTPFTLTGTATDPDGDPLTYSWEEWDLGSATTWSGGATTTSSPLFRFRPPKTTGSRTFPDSTVILAGYPTNPPSVMGGLKGEILPLVARKMNFRFTVRDNKAGGGAVTSGGAGGCQASFNSPFTINAIASTGPFVVTSPNGGESWPGNSSQTITWNVAGTNIAPINTSMVKISLSTDGGLTYPTVLGDSIANNGSAVLNIPNMQTTMARIKIEAVGNIYFDISNADFTISVPTTGFGFSDPAPAGAACNTSISASVTLGTTSILGFSSPINLSATGNPIGTTVAFGTNPLTPGDSTTVTLNGVNALSYGTYNVTITGTAGTIINTRVVSYTIQPGARPVITTQSSPQAGCIGSDVTLSVAATGAISYQWQLSTDGGNTYNNVIGATAASYILNNIASFQSGYYYRCLVTSQCNTIVSNPSLLTVHSLPTVTLSGSPITTLLPGQTTTLTASPSLSTIGSSTIATTWYQNAAVISNAGNIRVVDVEHSGSYQVNIQETWNDGSICNNQSAIVAINDSVSNKLFIFPSPNNGQFTISYYNNGGASGSRTVTIFDSKGSKVYNAVFAVTGPYTLMNIDAREMQTGIYYVIVGDMNGRKLADGKVLIH